METQSKKRYPYVRTLFLPDIPGQYKLWKTEIVNSAQRSHFIIQMGNFISCDDSLKDKVSSGPNNTLLELIFLWRATDPRWTQLVGPNEIAALNSPGIWTNLKAESYLQESWISKKPKMFTATANNGRLVTHGGLTYGEWRDIGSPETAEDAANLLNGKYAGTLYQGPCYRLGDFPNYSANPVWADPIMELYPSWVTAPVPMPFDQIHSSGLANGFFGTSAMGEKTSPMFYVDRLQSFKFGTKIHIKDMVFTSLDLRIKVGELVTTLPKGSAFYIEKIADENQ